MSHPFPLQRGDSTQGQTGLTESSTAADRRPDSTGPANPPGDHPAPQFGEPETPLYKIGYLKPTSFLAPPYPVIETQGDTSGTGTDIYEVDVYSYGDGYDPTAPTRVRQADHWQMDSDFDGERN